MIFFFLSFLSFLSFIVFFNFTLFYLYHFNLSQNKFIIFLHYLTPIWFILGFTTLFYLNIFTFNEVFFISIYGDKNTCNKFNLGGNVEVNKDAAEALQSNIGFALTVAGVAGPVEKAISKSSLPALKKLV